MSDAACQRLRKISGVGPMVSAATVAANGAAFKRGRDFAAWLGLVPKQHSTGGKAKLLGITKRGNRYLRKLFVHGARAVLLRVKCDTGGLGQWVHSLAAGAPRNKFSWRLPTNSPGSPGWCCRAATNITTSP